MLILQIDTDVKQDSNTVKPSTQDKNDSTASSANDSVEEFEVEKVKDYKWCRATVRLSDIFIYIRQSVDGRQAVVC